jgi:hypothetical protein
MSKNHIRIFYIILAIVSFAAGALLMHFYPKPINGTTPFFSISPISAIGLILIFIGLILKSSKYKTIFLVAGLILLLFPLLGSLVPLISI